MTKLQLCQYCCFASLLEITKYWELQFNFPLKTRIANYLLARLHIYLPHVKLLCNAQPCARDTLPWYSSQNCTHFIVIYWCLLAHTNGVSKLRTHNRACALPSPSPFPYLMAKIIPVVQLAAHAKSSTLYGRSYGHKSKCFRLDGLLAPLRAPLSLLQLQRS